MQTVHFEHVAAPSAKLDADEVEQRIIRAYVQLACTAPDGGGSRTVTVARFGVLEVRLTEVPVADLPSFIPAFWMEVYSHSNRSVIDSYGCTEFDERELDEAVAMVLHASQRDQAIH